MSGSSGLLHPFTKAHYQNEGDNIRVTEEDGTTGLFRPDGSWLEGDLRWCDPQLCNWLSGPRFVNHRLDQSGE